MGDDFDDRRRRIGIGLDVHSAERISARHGQGEREQHHDQWIVDRPVNEFGDHGSRLGKALEPKVARPLPLGRTGLLFRFRGRELPLAKGGLQLHGFTGGNPFADVQLVLAGSLLFVGQMAANVDHVVILAGHGDAPRLEAKFVGLFLHEHDAFAAVLHQRSGGDLDHALVRRQ